MLPSPREYEQLQRILPRSERNVNEPSYFSLIPTSSSNMSSSSTDTSSGSYENYHSLSSAETQEFRPYQLFKSSCDTSIHPSKDRSFFGSSNHSKVSRQISQTPFLRSDRPTPRRTIIPETIKKNHLDLYNELFTTKEIEITPEPPTIRSLQALNRFPDLSSAPSSTPYTANLNKWELDMDKPNSQILISSMNNDISPHAAKLVPNHLSNSNWLDFETLESSSGTFSETSISNRNSIMSPSSYEFLPPVSPIRQFERINQAVNSSGTVSQGSAMSTGTDNMARSSPIRTSAKYERQNLGAGSSLGTFRESSISPNCNINYPGFMENMARVSPLDNQRNIVRLNQGSSSGMYGENSFSPTMKSREMPQHSPIRNPINFEGLNWDARSSSGIFSETSISSITSISPGSIGYMPRVSPITNPINFERLNEDAVSFSGIKTDRLCTFCKKNGERQKVYSTHTVKVKVGNKQIVTCPVLRSHVCTMCGGTGDNAHTVTYCPLVSDSNKRRPPSTTVTLKSTRMKSNGKKRNNYNN
ncbi:unnamed protein product [Pieris macdunnoughi]|uniref:Nanos-type domain-containing protein n=1 Tax=Pieris macdunnoughi TaxID=345717 RepID=A0A821XYN7_9NEOP|nr:unnamed protein product [Pieris macdunnoughi]